ncbi:MAG: site-specific DNA-methyltransferase, partial [Alphaproteobacteria bacterium]|nr:site-specific DNA-methyltransferase [Alphaproteobacteria bacterium]
MQHTFELSPIIAKNVISKPNISAFFKDIEEISLINLLKYSDKMRKDRDLTRSLVSFQGNKNLSSFRWYKFKEAFSADLVQLIFDRYKINSGTVLDPFAGSGTTLFSSIENGLSADGIELLPIGQQIILSRNILTGEFSKDDWNTIESWRIQRPWKTYNNRKALTTLRITEGAYPLETQVSIEKYLSLLETESSNVASVLKFALLCILEEVSFTRKDGQYLRWDSRSGHNEGKIPFNKGKIESF